MGKRASVGVIVFGILLILSSLFNVTGLNLDATRFLLQPLPEALIVVFFYISVVCVVLSFVSGVGVFFLKDIFRKIVLFIGSYSIFTYVVFGYTTFSNMPRFIDREITEMMATTPAVPEQAFYSIMWACCIAFLILDFAFAVCLVYYFTRPKVKEQFK